MAYKPPGEKIAGGATSRGGGPADFGGPRSFVWKHSNLTHICLIHIYTSFKGNIKWKRYRIFQGAAPRNISNPHKMPVYCSINSLYIIVLHSFAMPPHLWPQWRSYVRWGFFLIARGMAHVRSLVFLTEPPNRRKRWVSPPPQDSYFFTGQPPLT